MTDCKNCPYTDEYCASGDCERDNDLTEQCKKGELHDGWYWVKRVTWSECINMLYYWSDTFLDGDVPIDNDEIMEVLAPVPSYEEWKEYQELDEDYKRNVQLAIRFSLEADILKYLLKECKDVMNMAGYVFAKVKDVEKARKLLQQIDEVLK